jgi:hypothetical protein
VCNGIKRQRSDVCSYMHGAIFSCMWRKIFFKVDEDKFKKGDAEK